jgi:hypothetical protein
MFMIAFLWREGRFLLTVSSSRADLAIRDAMMNHWGVVHILRGVMAVAGWNEAHGLRDCHRNKTKPRHPSHVRESNGRKLKKFRQDAVVYEFR